MVVGLEKARILQGVPVPDNQRRLCLGYERGQIDAGECRLGEDVDLRNNPLVGSGWLSRQNLFQHAI